MSQRALADAVGVTSSTVSHWSRGRSTPEPERVGAIEQVLGFNAGELARLLYGLETADCTVEGAVMASERLTTDQKQVIIATYRQFIGYNDAARPRRPRRG